MLTSSLSESFGAGPGRFKACWITVDPFIVSSTMVKMVVRTVALSSIGSALLVCLDVYKRKRTIVLPPCQLLAQSVVVLLRELMAEDGSIYVHCDWRVNSHLRLIMDEIFGSTNFHNEISWVKNSLGAKGKAKQYPKNQDLLLFYTKSDTYTFNKQMKEQEEAIEFVNGKEKLPTGYKKDAVGRYYWTSP